VKKAINSSVLFFLVSVLLLSSCSTVYKNGYYQTKRYKFVEKSPRIVTKKSLSNKWNKTVVLSENLSSKNVISDLKSDYRTLGYNIDNPIHFLTTNSNEEMTIQLNQFKRKDVTKMVKNLVKETKLNAQITEDSCDLIVFKNGDEEWGYVMEVSRYEVRYKKCSYIDGPTRVVDTRDILFIRYKNGEKEIFNNEVSRLSEDEIRNYEYYEKNSSSGAGLTVFGVILIIIGGLVTLFTSILFGLMAIALGVILLSIGKN